MNILAISLAYPPLAYPRSIQVARLLKHTEARTVLFCADEPGARLDSSMEPEAEARLESCQRVPVPRKLSSNLLNRLTFRLYRPMWNRRNLAPDTYKGWGEDVLDHVCNYLKKEDFRPDVIVTFAQPFTDHLIGLELKKRLRLPWFAHFSDPWVDNPFSCADEKTRSLNVDLERLVADEADILAFTSQETADLFFEKYPPILRRKSAVLPQCFDSLQFHGERPSGKITLRYLGNFYGRRTPRPLLEGLRLLISEDPLILRDVSIELVGSGDTEEVGKMAAALPPGLVTVGSSVSYSESLMLMRSADALIVIDAPAETSVFLPSKLIDYIGARRPILGITPQGTAQKLIAELGGSVADPTNPRAIADIFRALIPELGRRRDSDDDSWGSENVRKRFTTEAVSGAFNEMLTELTRRSPLFETR